MKNEKLYFAPELDNLSAYNLRDILTWMSEEGIASTQIFSAKVERGTETFYCKEDQTHYDKDDGMCGKKSCNNYMPRNGKNGICKHYGYIYDYGTEYELRSNGTLRRVQLLPDIPENIEF